jgi:hypothetical protein
MNEFSNGFEFRGLWCFPPPPGSNVYTYVPLVADLDRHPDGAPAFSLIQTGSRGFLMLTAVWRATPAAIEDLRREIVARAGLPDPQAITLTMSPVQVARCDLLLGDGVGTFQTLATSTTSGTPPYSALFNVSLTEQQFPQVAAAVNGRAGFLAVEYDASLPTEVRASARLTPLSSRFVQWLRDAGGTDQSAFRSALEEAIQDGLAAVTVSLPEQPSSQLVGTLYEQLMDRAVAVLPRLIGSWEGDGIGVLEVAIELAQNASQPLRPTVDVAALVIDPARINVVAGPSTERSPVFPRPLRVSLDFDPDGAPLAWVRVRSGMSEVLLKAPDFRRADLSGDWRAGPLTITAGFTNGADNRSMDIPPPDGTELRLQPEQLGLRAFSIDAKPLADAGARSAEISLRYRPPQRSGEQRETLQFGNGTWATRWWVVTATSSWLRYLEYSWKATSLDGRVTGASTATAGSPHVVLSLQGGISHAAN